MIVKKLTPTKIGNSMGFIIPKKKIKLDKDLEYDVTVSESKL